MLSSLHLVNVNYFGTTGFEKLDKERNNEGKLNCAFATG